MNRRDNEEERTDGGGRQDPLEGRFRRIGCQTRGLFVWILLGLALASMFWGPLSDRFGGATPVPYLLVTGAKWPLP
ncbi:MAG: hypothetical protein ACOC8C_01235, partial [Chloroflexota bacterium]